MVRLSVLAVIVTAVTSVAAGVLGTTCQCLNPDGSHCCISYGIEDCQAQCKDAGRNSHKCNANGKWSSVSWWTATGRAECTN